MTSQNLISLLIVVILWAVAWQFRALKVRQAILLGASYFFIRNWVFNYEKIIFFALLASWPINLVVKIQ
jgi:hypothetical protein